MKSIRDLRKILPGLAISSPHQTCLLSDDRGTQQLILLDQVHLIWIQRVSSRRQTRSRSMLALSHALDLGRGALERRCKTSNKTSITSVNQVKSLRTQPKRYSQSFLVEFKADQLASLSWYFMNFSNSGAFNASLRSGPADLLGQSAMFFSIQMFICV
jgi:hypothetical protein